MSRWLEAKVLSSQDEQRLYAARLQEVSWLPDSNRVGGGQSAW